MTNLTETTHIEPNDDRFYINRGIFYHAKGEYDLAIVDFTEAIRLKPDDAKAYNDCAVSYDKIGDKLRAEADRQKANELRKKQS